MAKEDAFCSAGILAYAEHGNINIPLSKTGKILADLIRQNYPERIFNHDKTDLAVITSFNDHPSTEYSDVEQLFEKAEIIYDEYLLNKEFQQTLDS